MALSNVCNGCLSVDRKLTLIEKHAKLYHQMLLKKSTDKTKKILMCWECHKTLHNIHLFRMKITQAQKLLSDKLPTAYRSLSNLTHLKKIDEYQLTIYEEEKINAVNIEIEVKNEKKEIEIHPEFYNHDTDLKLPEIKEEYKDEDDNFDDRDDCFDNREPKVELGSVETPKVLLKMKQRRKKRGPLKKYKTIIMADIQDKRSFYDIEKIDQKSAEKWMEWKKKKTSKMKFQCSFCFRGFAHQKLYERHLASRHNKRHKYECDLCGFRFALYIKLHRHVGAHYAQFACKLCALTLPARAALYAHLVHTHSKQIECRVCSARFDCNKVRQLYAHYRAAHGRRKICDYCGAGCTTKDRLARHIKNRHTLIQCKPCGIVYKSIHSLKEHNARRHVVDASERNYCVECDVQFANSRLYQFHIKRSTKHNVKPRYPCPECDKTYVNRHSMVDHVNMYHKESKHVCTICDKRFMTNHRLRYHQKYTHEKMPKPKRHICSYCSKGFYAKGVLENHVRTHTGERPFACAHCPAAFAQKVALRSHERSAHK